MKLGKSGAGWDFLRLVVYGAASVALATFTCFHFHLSTAGTIPVLFLVVVLHSLAGNSLSSGVIAVLSAVALDYFFTTPVFSLRIDDPVQALALVSFAITSLVITRLVTRVRLEAKAASDQRDRVDRLYRLSQRLLALSADDLASASFLSPFHQLFGVNAVCIVDADSAELHMAGTSSFGLAEKTRDAHLHARDRDDRASNIAVRCVMLEDQLIAAIGFEGLQHPAETAGPLAALAAAFLERIKAFQKASEASAAAQSEIYRSAVLDALAHEFKTPLATILAAIGGLRESSSFLPEQEELADTVENEAARLGELTTRLLRTARLEREEIKPSARPVDFGALCSRIAGQYASRSSDRAIHVVTHEPVYVFADPELLGLIVGQLIENACKYSSPGSDVTLTTEQRGEFAVLRVSNNGSSIPAGERNRIFERFYRGAVARNSTSGSGLGLYVARKIADAHGGMLELETAIPQENCVTFSLKLPSAKESAEYVLTSR
jgi:two-component system sensor histidine kinase KdpD